MTLTLRIENLTTLPDGGPLSVSIKGKRGLDIGRDQYLDWTLPDPSRFISGKHCEVRWHDGGYWLHDISTNGTFLNGADSRLKSPHRLRNGDRFVIGQYIIGATLDEEAAEPDETAPSHAPSRDDNLWDGGPDAAEPIDPRQLKGPHDAVPGRPDFLDWAADVPMPVTRPAQPSAGSAFSVRGPSIATGADYDSWADGPPPPPAAPPEIIPVPTPRRPDAGESRRQRGGTGTGAPGDAAAQLGCGRDGDIFPARRARRRPAGRRVRRARSRRNGRTTRPALETRHRQHEAIAGGPPASQTIGAQPQPDDGAGTRQQSAQIRAVAEDALRIMFAARGRSYLDAERAFAQGFDDLKKHQIKTYAAMQQAVTLLMKDVDPATIEAASQSDRGLAGMVGSRKARLWDVYVARWQAHARRHDNGILDTFMDYFARCYDGE